MQHMCLLKASRMSQWIDSCKTGDPFPAPTRWLHNEWFLNSSSRDQTHLTFMGSKYTGYIQTHAGKILTLIIFKKCRETFSQKTIKDTTLYLWSARNSEDWSKKTAKSQALPKVSSLYIYISRWQSRSTARLLTKTKQKPILYNILLKKLEDLAVWNTILDYSNKLNLF